MTNISAFDNAIEYLKSELAKIRTGRATPTLVEGLVIDYYGTKTPLVQLASISAPDVKTLVIQPWDANASKNIEKAVRDASLGLQPVNEGQRIRIIIPQLTEERRTEFGKLVNQKIEETKVRIRSTREEILKKLQKEKNDGEIREDDFFRKQKELQKSVDQANDFVMQCGEAKHKEISTV
ncbi:MAG: ribosome recycling factor [Candidatus Kerfeldbacteria bacterium RIFCSPLOWO2_01_FULL_48_11]|uniref:Ribosome-recycling factor n=1 Tax=Candidatus Kerfeldbacteria bacterium RIFCSPLOWO2_01_FULL_48_11 TaxID=1798543 RepID=A0A1G2B0U4_9BACT|nr:MAG: Ribosome-recycling factor [Parcubacteria group bacterium GW2011_GWA2_48_9]KKW16225.1 MAG: Ribosome-recycling factor [Parcubacteria group bacterium GW2011_GWC2_49_9]OGY82778.1 MAG: ribosome recycling factor [Candidatus Kerfeldbacteria bacterium RIFCSPLOWO2_01_FULL_48_11]HCJ52672.1 ribosome recycling factor [Candidatus Kerfeldbacteria bacterium]HCM67772.1 ribosome recycling factor [Candidatus Kerfeldbacteria bacterium]